MPETPQPGTDSAVERRGRDRRFPEVHSAAGRSGPGPGPRREDGGEAADPDGEREAQQEHHPAGQRRQDLEKRPRGEGIRGALVVGAVHLCGLWLSYLPNYSEYQDGHVKELTLNKLFSSSCELQ